MFTPGFKYFFGLATLGLIGAFVFGLSSGDLSGPDYFGFVDKNAVVGLLSLGWKGNVGNGLGFFVLIVFASAAAFLSFTVVAFRDADVESVAELGGGSPMPPPQRPTAPSYWPAASALGVGVLLSPVYRAHGHLGDLARDVRFNALQQDALGHLRRQA